MHSIKIYTAIFALIGAVYWGCTKSIVREDTAMKQYAPADESAIRSMRETVEATNKNSPESYSANFYVFGASHGKIFRSLGRAQFDRKQDSLHFSFVDYIFNTPITSFFMEGEVIQILLPIEKKMYVDNRKTIRLANYTGFDINFDILHDLSIGKIPLLRDYSIRQGLNAKTETASLLILENKKFIETISFNKGEPDKILIVDKSSGDKVEIYFKKIIAKGPSRFFEQLKIVSPGNDLSLEINFNKIQINVPVKVSTTKNSKLPANLQIINM